MTDTDFRYLFSDLSNRATKISFNLASFAKEYSGIKVIGCGGLHNPEKAQEILNDGDADFIASGKGALADPSLPKKIASGISPLDFDPGMISPVATIENTRNWKTQNL